MSNAPTPAQLRRAAEDITRTSGRDDGEGAPWLAEWDAMQRLLASDEPPAPAVEVLEAHLEPAPVPSVPTEADPEPRADA